MKSTASTTSRLAVLKCGIQAYVQLSKPREPKCGLTMNYGRYPKSCGGFLSKLRYIPSLRHTGLPGNPPSNCLTCRHNMGGRTRKGQAHRRGGEGFRELFGGSWGFFDIQDRHIDTDMDLDADTEVHTYINIDIDIRMSIDVDVDLILEIVWMLKRVWGPRLRRPHYLRTR